MKTQEQYEAEYKAKLLDDLMGLVLEAIAEDITNAEIRQAVETALKA